MSKKKVKYKGLSQGGISSEEAPSDIDLLPSERSHGQTDNIVENEWPQSKQTIYQWMLSNPQTKLPFFYFVIASFLFVALAIYYLMDSNTAFILSGLMGLITISYALNHFRGLLSLKDEVDSFFENNKVFRKENMELALQVKSLKEAHTELKNVHKDLEDINHRTKENNMKFRQIEENLKISNYDTVQGIGMIRTHAKQLVDSWKKNLMQRERDVITRVYDRIEISDETEGVSREEFEQFSEMLPDGYKQRFNRLGTFRKLAKDKSVIEYNDLRSCMDVFAEMDVDNCDIEFEITKTPTNKPKIAKNRPKSVAYEEEEEQPQFLRQISIQKRSKPGTTFDYVDTVDYI